MRMRRRVGGFGRDAELLAERFQQVGALGVKLGELRGEVVFAFLEVNGPWNAKVADSVDSPSVGVPGLGDRHDRGGELALFRLMVVVEDAARGADVEDRNQPRQLSVGLRL